MSRIYEAIKNATEARLSNGLAASDSLGEMVLPERRVNPRETLDSDITVYGRTERDAPFYEQVSAIRGNANGGQFHLAVPVGEGQDLLLINNRTSQQQICTVISARNLDIQRCEVSVSFPLSNEEFWELPEVTARSRS